VSSSYRFAGPFVVRVVGSAMVLGGLLLVVLVVLVAVLSLPTAVLTAGIAAVLVVVVALVALRRVVVVSFDEVGYRIRYVRGAGVRQATWREVEDVAAATVVGERCVVLHLQDGRTSTVPVRVLAATSEDFVGDLREHLNRGHGYRRLPGRPG
jgi:hypothetical protein